MKMLQQLFSLQSRISAKKRRVTKKLFEIETLETRVVFAYVSGGSLVVDGTNAADVVTVSDARTYFRVSENGWVQNFSRAAVTTGQFYFRGNGGDDYFSASTNSLQIVADGGLGNDTISGGARGDILAGGGGNDSIYGQEGNDVIYGNDGDDAVWAGDGNDQVYGGWGNDTLAGEAHDDYLRGEGGSDTLYGNDGNGPPTPTNPRSSAVNLTAACPEHAIDSRQIAFFLTD